MRLSKSFPALRRSKGPAQAAELCLFRDLSFEVGPGEMIAIVGESGSGKSSLLHLLAALDRPTSGEVWLGDQEVTTLSAGGAAQLRNRDVGYVWQFHYLLPEFTAAENIAMPLLARGDRQQDALEQARTWLGLVGLTDREHHRSGELSGGEQQRLSVARALIAGPRLLLADEPTGDLDDSNAEAIFALLQQLTRERSLATLVVTHNLAFAARCDRVLRLKAGELVAE